MNTMINAEELFRGSCAKARKIRENPDKVEKLLKRLEKKLQGLPVLKDTLAFLPRMGMMINSYIRKQYTEIPAGIILAVIAAVVYFVCPADLIPDLIPGAGFLDDAAVVGAALKLAQSDLEEYMDWRARQGLGS